jgi:D-glycero-D-manno-heptose 1,7-bisphosphate phosphatase
MGQRPILIVLDRDGVLNRTVPNPAEPRPDSPLRLSEVEVFPWVPEVLRALTAAGCGVVIATNQPAAAKGKIARADLEAVHAEVVRQAEAVGGAILSSHICFHRAEDGCICRKPATGLLVEAFAQHPEYAPNDAWMVGDRATDVLAGVSFGMKTAYLGDAASSDYRALETRAVRPIFCGVDLRQFAGFFLGAGLFSTTPPAP